MGIQSPQSLKSYFYQILRQNSIPVSTDISCEGFRPVKMLVTIRTDRSNEVLVPNKGQFYTDCTASYPNKHPIDDMVMLSAKRLVDELFNCGDDIVAVIQRTTVYPIGACVFDNKVYVYINVVIDHTLKNESFFKTKGCHFEPIQSLSPETDLGKELIKHLTIVKGDSADA